ncbi:MAG: hypothetical protein ACOCTI_07820 [Phycisphaeraceae bacterium]
MTDEPAEFTCPLSRAEVVERYFLEHRAKLLDVAAFLDRVERAKPEHDPADRDYRLRAIDAAIEALSPSAIAVYA